LRNVSATSRFCDGEKRSPAVLALSWFFTNSNNLSRRG
jgi:hypothetical protein